MLPPRRALVAALGLTAVLAAAGPRYGYHRDEMYFIEAGRHPAWGYPDSPPLVPLLAAGWHAVTGGSLFAFRLLPAVAAGLIVLVASATSAALGGSRAEQAAAAWLAAVAALVVAVGHLFSTTTFDVLLTGLVMLLLLRALDRGLASWLLLGAVAGVALEVKTLPATVLGCALVALLAVGPRAAVRTPGPWASAAAAAALAAPNLWWQAAHGWPQLELARAISAGSSGTSTARWLVVPLQVTIGGPVLAVVMGAGLVALLRSRNRWLAVTYLVLLVVVMITGGKAYYTAGLAPALLAAGAPAALRWSSAARWRRRVAWGLLALHVAATALITLPVLPLGWLHRTPVVALNYDVGEMVGWPRLVATVHSVAAALPRSEVDRAVVVTANYGEAGALDLARRSGGGLPRVYSGHNGYGLWGPPPSDAAPVVLVGWYSEDEAARLFDGCRVVARIDNGVQLENDEQGAPVRVCAGPRQPWAALWPSIRHLG